MDKNLHIMISFDWQVGVIQPALGPAMIHVFADIYLD